MSLERRPSDMKELPESYLRIIECLRLAHAEGKLSLSPAEVREQSGLGCREVADAQRKMLDLGLLDKLEDEGFSLSALGLKRMPTQTQHGTEEQAAGLVSLLFELQQCSSRWRETVMESSLGSGEKEVLGAAGDLLLSHPATFELLRRMISKGR